MSEWAYRRIRDLLNTSYAGEWGDPPSPGNARVLRATDIDSDGRINGQGALRQISPAAVQTKRLQHGDVMLEASGGSPEKPVGRVAFYSGQESDGPFLTSNFYKTLRPAGDVDPKFLHWALLRFYRQPDILQYQQQTTGIINLKFQDYLDAKVRSPVARKEQKLIADILDTLDIQIQKTEALIAKLEKVKEGLLHDLLTRGIDENGQLRPSPEQTPELYKDSPLGLIPREWCTACLSEISEKITDGTHQAVKTIAADETSVPFLYVSCVRNGKILWDQAAAISRSDFLAISKGREPHRGMILYTAVGSYGHAAAVEKESHFSFQRHISCISLKSKRAEPRFLSYFLNSPRSKRHADQVALGKH
ncbi:restriction endonuclease subunit S [Thioalkalivibrio sp. HL-Eb18]|uniref:restriction endonuclease subunit S n=1 Tax=Thioalkalivibrio sp. HL-Eb18 TaxID=1266913 RepID=UPI0009DA82CC|nr:restriction endonuclease subunit S [Thioalkalivibrio sp. HL-Eb18]